MSLQENNQEVNEQKEEKKEKKTNEVWEWTKSIFIALIAALLIKYFIFSPTIVKGPSMEPTFHENNRLIADRISVITNRMPQRGDIITFEAPNTPEFHKEKKTISDKLRYMFFERKDYIKRVIGLPGDHVQIKDESVYLNGKKLEEKYLDNVPTNITGEYSDLIVPEGQVFVLGDNRTNSLDGRVFGPISQKLIDGKIVFRFWPLTKFGKVK
jgi:signal peptidase I